MVRVYSVVKGIEMRRRKAFLCTFTNLNKASRGFERIQEERISYREVGPVKLLHTRSIQRGI